MRDTYHCSEARPRQDMSTRMLKEGRDEGGMETPVMWKAKRDGECRENRNLENSLGRMRPKHREEEAPLM